MKGQSCRAIFTVFRAEIEAKASDKFDRGMERPLPPPIYNFGR